MTMVSDFTFRWGTQDFGTACEMLSRNPYGIEKLNPEDVVLDVGANIGCFAIACLYSGAGKVVCYEPDEDNFPYLVKNLASFPKCETHKAAVWRSGVKSLSFTKVSPLHTAMGHCLFESDKKVDVVSIDDAIERAGGRIRFLKLDCEGAEWPILNGCTRLDCVQECAAELHHGMINPDWPWDCTGQGMKNLLARAGFSDVQLFGHGLNTIVQARR